MPILSGPTGRGSGICLLSLDSGGPRGVSQLTVLAQLMHRLKHDSGNDHMDKPCGVFDMIGGVGSGGFIAILLVLFGLTAEETLEEFIDLAVNILDKRDMDAETRTAALRGHIDKLLEKHGIDRSSRIMDLNGPSMACKLAVPISYKHHAGSIYILRNYSVRKEKPLNLIIAEAMMATLATPPMFTSTQILKDAATFEYTSADWTLTNPAEELIAEAYEALGAEQRVACILSLGCGHPGVFMAPKESNITEWNKFLENLVTDSERKAQAIDSRMGHLGIYHRFSVTSGLEKSNTTELNHLGDIVAHTKAYLDNATVSRKMDGCADSLRTRTGISSLDQLRNSGGGLVGSRQIPPVTDTFVMRKEPWEFIKKTMTRNLDGKTIGRPSKLIVTGVGGCGKTQLMLNFMKAYKSEFPFQIFIDGSSEDRIRADIMQYVRSLGTEYSQKGFEECLLFLSSQSDNTVRLLLYDNVDDPDLDLSPLLPPGDSCAIAITSRNYILGDVQPEAHLRLDIMELEEAVELLLHGHNDPHISLDQARADAAAIAEALGCLPVALQQACSYMRQTKCSAHAYLERLSTSRTKLLRLPIRQQLNARVVSTYAAFETSFLRLPDETKKLLRLLSQFHWNDFPLELVTIGAKYEFSQHEDIGFPHGDDFHIGKQLLEDIFLRNGEWETMNLDIMNLSLQNYSLVSVTRGIETLLLRMHPLVHEWVRIFIPGSEVNGYQSAAVLLLALDARTKRTAATQYLAGHVTHMFPQWKDLNLNNKAAFRSILYENGVYQGAVDLQELRRNPDTTTRILSNSLW